MKNMGGCFALSRVGAPREVNGIMWKENYVNMLKKNRKTSNGKLGNKYPSGQ